MSSAHHRNRPHNTHGAKRPSRQLHYVLVFCAVIAWYGVVTLFFAQPEVRISEIRVEKTYLLGENEVLATTQEALTKKFLSIQRDNRILIPRKHIRQLLKDTYPAITKVRLRMKGFDLLRVIITERPPLHLHCVDDPTQQSGEYCVYLDLSGIAFAQAPFIPNGDFYKFYTDHSPDESILLQKPVPKEHIALVDTLVEEFHKIGIVSHSARVNDTGFELSLHDIDGKLFAKDSHVRGIFKDLTSTRPPDRFAFITRTLLLDGALAQELKGRYDALYYVDLRFGENVYYQLQSAKPKKIIEVPQDEQPITTEEVPS